MSDTTFWEPTMGAMECLIDCLPPKAQERIVERLQLLARVQESQGDLVASRFSRALSGESVPVPRPKPNLRLVK
jgi:hypothetical protein